MTTNAGALDRFALRLVRATRDNRTSPWRQVLRLLGVDIPPEVRIGRDLYLPHVGAGHTVHWNTTIGDDVILNCGVVLGRSDLRGDPALPPRFVIGDGVVIGANAVLACRGGETLVVGAGTVIGANAVLTHSTGPGEVWVGNPARPLRREVEPEARVREHEVVLPAPEGLVAAPGVLV
ncbi:hypothetical protein [Cellulomonas endophytica]|uniref:hypothetical protein n=1 Tax=Cellulomonas endophytica TaxID=2494735 RepID=UPI001010A23D|nr:hypothetical protein [Cellulomonas endophytica]